MPLFRKKPVVIEAMQWIGGPHEPLDVFCGRNWTRADAVDADGPPDDPEHVVVWNALERQWLNVPVNHWIIRGVRGELYPCDPNVFTATYEPASAIPRERETI